MVIDPESQFIVPDHKDCLHQCLLRAAFLVIRIPSTIIFTSMSYLKPIPVAALYKAWVCGLSLVGIAGTSPAGGMEVCLL